MRDAAQGFARQNVSPKIRPALGTLPVQPELIAFAAAFVDLQQARHEADYDTSRRLTRKECLDLVNQAEQAFIDWDYVRRSLPADVFLVAMLTQKQMQI